MLEKSKSLLYACMICGGIKRISGEYIQVASLNPQELGDYAEKVEKHEVSHGVCPICLPLYMEQVKREIAELRDRKEKQNEQEKQNNRGKRGCFPAIKI